MIVFPRQHVKVRASVRLWKRKSSRAHRSVGALERRSKGTRTIPLPFLIPLSLSLPLQRSHSYHTSTDGGDDDPADPAGTPAEAGPPPTRPGVVVSSAHAATSCSTHRPASVSPSCMSVSRHVAAAGLGLEEGSGKSMTRLPRGVLGGFACLALRLSA